VDLSYWLSSRSKTFVMVCGIASVFGIGFVDYATGYEVSVSIYYLIPVGLVSWYVGSGAGIVIAVACAMSGVIADHVAGQIYSDPVVAYWNTSVILAFFLVVNYILAAMKRSFEEVNRLARTEPLTGLANPRAFFEIAENELNRARRYKTTFSVAYIDLDNFKTINDSFGHSTGDALLRSVATCLRAQTRATDLVARLGGDEFVVFLPETNSEQARAFTPRVQQHLLDLMKQSNWPVTFSIGVITFVNSPPSVNEIIREADSLMYAAKNAGKNRAEYAVFPALALQEH
jgi:diguanylate cyclase (GGDEF)-like protein